MPPSILEHTRRKKQLRTIVIIGIVDFHTYPRKAGPFFVTMIIPFVEDPFIHRQISPKLTADLPTGCASRQMLCHSLPRQCVGIVRNPLSRRYFERNAWKVMPTCRPLIKTRDFELNGNTADVEQYRLFLITDFGTAYQRETVA